MTCGVVIVAAGRGARLGGVAKALITLGDGRSFLAAIWDAARAGGVTAGAVVVGAPFAAEVVAAAADLGLAAVVNPDPARGMGSSVATGFAHAVVQWTHDAALMWPVDHPFVHTATVRSLVDRVTPDTIVVPRLGGAGGHPTAFGRGLWPELAACASLPAGARSVVRAEGARVVELAVEDPGVVRDIDRPGDLPA